MQEPEPGDIRVSEEGGVFLVIADTTQRKQAYRRVWLRTYSDDSGGFVSGKHKPSLSEQTLTKYPGKYICNICEDLFDIAYEISKGK